MYYTYRTWSVIILLFCESKQNCLPFKLLCFIIKEEEENEEDEEEEEEEERNKYTRANSLSNITELLINSKLTI